jgi:hypothetical protein
MSPIPQNNFFFEGRIKYTLSIHFVHGTEINSLWSNGSLISLQNSGQKNPLEIKLHNGE